MSRSGAARVLLQLIISNEVKRLESHLKNGDSASWREIIRYEFEITDLMTDKLRGHEALPKLLAYEIATLSPLHIAAMLGRLDILVSLLDKEVPVDVTLQSGTTALHMACFGGQAEVARVLLDVYKAELMIQDRYGWTALHYASTEGQLPVVQLLVESYDVDVSTRDQDGTTAAFRADINGHAEIVTYLCAHSTDDELLKVLDTLESDLEAYAKPAHELYSKVNKKPTPGIPSNTAWEKNHAYTLGKNGDSTMPNPKPRSNSITPGDGTSDSSTLNKKQYSKSVPLRSKQIGKNTIRRLLRREVERAMSRHDDYMNPYDVADGREPEDAVRIGGNDGVGVNTLKGMMREELDRYRRVMLKPDAEDSLISTESPDDAYDETYASLSSLPVAPPPPPAAPPLPPRNQQMLLNALADEADLSGSVRLRQNEVISAALAESFRKISPQLGPSWKALARSLPMDSDSSIVERRIKDIERSNPGNQSKQGIHALVEWRINKGSDATMDNLIMGLRKCGLYDVIKDVEKISQEYTA